MAQTISYSNLKDKLQEFLETTKDKEGDLKYRTRISQVVAKTSMSLLVDYEDLALFDPEISQEIQTHPESTFKAFEDAAFEVISQEIPSYKERFRDLKVRLRSLPGAISVREISSDKLDKLVAVTGMIVRVSELKPLALEAGFRCRRCNEITVEKQSGLWLRKPQKCEHCDETHNLEIEPTESTFIDFQVLRMQELPEDLPPGQLPQASEIHLLGNLVNSARPGDRATITGIIRAEPEQSQAGKSRVFHSHVESNYVEIMGKEPENVQLAKEDVDKIRKMVAQPGAYERLVKSIAPGIHGFETQKEAVLLLCIGAPRTKMPDGSTLRGDINVLLVGDPGTAKSELLKYAARAAPRGLYTSGRGSTAAGLTAAVIRDKSGMMSLEAGAVVLADQGVACIDEFDKMRTEDRSALHETMEQQTVSVAKGGIVATLNARASILAAANPIFGKYDPYRNIADNLNLPIPLLTRFDLIFVIRDIPDKARDEELAKHVLGMHETGAYPEKPPVDFKLLKKYFTYAKKINPVLTKAAKERIQEYYLQMRAAGSESMITVTPRQLEALIRLSVARARALLHKEVTEEDSIHAVSLVKRMLETVGVDVRTGQIDLGVLHGKPLSERNLLQTAVDVFKELEGDPKNPVDSRVFVDTLVKTGKFDQDEAQRMLQSLNRNGQIYETKPGQYRKI